MGPKAIFGVVGIFHLITYSYLVSSCCDQSLRLTARHAFRNSPSAKLDLKLKDEKISDTRRSKTMKWRKLWLVFDVYLQGIVASVAVSKVVVFYMAFNLPI